MQAKGKIKTVCPVRQVEYDGHTHTRQDFILEVKKPNKNKYDSIGLTLQDKDIEKYNIHVGELYNIIYDSVSRVSVRPEGDECFDRKTVHYMHKIPDTSESNETEK